MHNFKELKVWQESRRFCKLVYEITNQLPESEKFGLISQIRRSVISIPSNIAEGSGRSSNKEFSKFISYSLGSAYELETQLLIACDLGCLKEENLKQEFELLISIQKMLNKFNDHLKSNR